MEVLQQITVAYVSSFVQDSTLKLVMVVTLLTINQVILIINSHTKVAHQQPVVRARCAFRQLKEAEQAGLSHE